MMQSIHYKNAYDNIFNQMPKWKQLAIKQDSEKNNMSGLLMDFIDKVIETAEKEFESQSIIEAESQKTKSQNTVNKKKSDNSIKKKSVSKKLKNKEK